MNQEIKQDYRTALGILKSLQPPKQPQSMTALEESLARLNLWQRKFRLASERDWHAAAKHASSHLRTSLENVRVQIGYALDELARLSVSRIEPTLSSIHADIIGLRAEFENVEIDHSCQCLTVETSPITLEGIELGRFQIQLNWQNMNRSMPYSIVALDPNYPTCSSSVIHPHVHGESLCEGEGADGIRRALDEGRLFDFFCVVDQVLRNYNPDSAYVQLEDWNGVSCDSCGDHMDSDDAVHCSKCETQHCLDCTTSCENCGDRYCSDCITSCRCCHQDVCKDCIAACDGCDEEFCQPCLFERTCDDCISQQNEASEEELEDESSNPTVHTVRDGEVTVPA